MAKISLTIVTFNENEAKAIKKLFIDLLDPPSQWTSVKTDKIRWGNKLAIHHENLSAQGNVVAAACLSTLFANPASCPDYVLFYGCAGVLDSQYCNHAFLVGKVSYMSLGTVNPGSSNANEKVTLKNKWLCNTGPSTNPLPPITLQPSATTSVYDFCAGTGLTKAYVAATDKVIKVPPATQSPKPSSSSPPPSYTKDEWTYAESLAYVETLSNGIPVIVDMESYGIGKIAMPNNLNDRIIIIRITTDALADKNAKNDQEKLLKDGLSSVGIFILNIIQSI